MFESSFSETISGTFRQWGWDSKGESVRERKNTEQVLMLFIHETSIVCSILIPFSIYRKWYQDRTYDTCLMDKEHQHLFRILSFSNTFSLTIPAPLTKRATNCFGKATFKHSSENTFLKVSLHYDFIIEILFLEFYLCFDFIFTEIHILLQCHLAFFTSANPLYEALSPIPL